MYKVDELVQKPAARKGSFYRATNLPIEEMVGLRS
jgi:hypothetical protein